MLNPFSMIVACLDIVVRRFAHTQAYNSCNVMKCYSETRSQGASYDAVHGFLNPFLLIDTSMLTWYHYSSKLVYTV